MLGISIKEVIPPATAAFASSFVQAEDKLVTAQNEQVKFSELITKLDSDKNGLLSQPEAQASKNKVLQGNFKKMDLNNDEQISEQEFNDFLALMESQKTQFTKSAS